MILNTNDSSQLYCQDKNILEEHSAVEPIKSKSATTPDVQLIGSHLTEPPQSLEVPLKLSENFVSVCVCVCVQAGVRWKRMEMDFQEQGGGRVDSCQWWCCLKRWLYIKDKRRPSSR